jgi:hypothetical protein
MSVAIQPTALSLAFDDYPPTPPRLAGRFAADLVREVYRLLAQSKRAAGLPVAREHRRPSVRARAPSGA